MPNIPTLYLDSLLLLLIIQHHPRLHSEVHIYIRSLLSAHETLTHISSEQHRKKLVNITVAVPLDAVAAVSQNTDASKMADALATITKAVIAGVKGLPYKIEPATATREEDNLSIRSFDSDEPASAPPPTKRAKVSATETRSAGSFRINVVTAGRKRHEFLVRSTTTVRDLQNGMMQREGFEPKTQRMLFDGQSIRPHEVLRDVRLPSL